ncbi:uncharacterized protein isoform X2 [Rhodnius prolixus]|uniref:uncharacterized protein isoform X2 n=1 Tax=Rhodnius prolixus TaxID=13249 RepID=UPI003D189692
MELFSAQPPPEISCTGEKESSIKGREFRRVIPWNRGSVARKVGSKRIRLGIQCSNHSGTV